jgi:hypothetical protein
MKLHELAHARAGDKGNTSDLTVFAYDPGSFDLLKRHLTPERVKAHLGQIVQGEVVRYVLPGVSALKFVLGETLGGGVTRTLALDAHGKCLASVLLSLELPDEQNPVRPRYRRP